MVKISRKFALAVLLSLAPQAFAGSQPTAEHTLRVMTFNTMCSVCDSGHEDGPWKDRLNHIADTVRRQDPDLISFQELTTNKPVRKLLDMLDQEYVGLWDSHGIWPGTDSVLFVRKSRFKIIEHQGAWLGPNAPHFSFGWHFGIPRRFEWARLVDTETGQEFIFSGSHFDNNFPNKDHSAAYFQNFVKHQSVPVIFAGDSNLRPEFDGYKVLLGDNMRNTFDEHGELTASANAPYKISEYCEDDEAIKSHWPDCRIDHVLISKDAPWRVKSWGEDLYRYFKGVHFVSDHRAVVVDLVPAAN